MQNNEVARTERSIIKAEPGWFAVLHLIRAGRDPETGKRWDDFLVLAPIIAWEIERNDEPGKPGRSRTSRLIWHDVTPITVDVPPVAGIRYIKRPDGNFICGDAIEDNEKDAIAHIKSEEDEAGEAHAGDVRNNSIVSGGKSSSAPVTVDLAENPTPFTGTPIPRAR